MCGYSRCAALKIVPSHGQVPAQQVCEQILPAGANFSETSWRGSTLGMDANARFGICRFVAQRGRGKNPSFLHQPVPELQRRNLSDGVWMAENAELTAESSTLKQNQSQSSIKQSRPKEKKKKKKEEKRNPQEVKIPSSSDSAVWWLSLAQLLNKSKFLASLKSSSHHDICMLV